MRPAALPHHHAGDRLAGKERALHVHGAREIEILLGDFLGRVLWTESRVVDEGVDAAEARDNRIDRGGDCAEVGDVHLQRARRDGRAPDLVRQIASR